MIVHVLLHDELLVMLCVILGQDETLWYGTCLVCVVVVRVICMIYCGLPLLVLLLDYMYIYIYIYRSDSNSLYCNYSLVSGAIYYASNDRCEYIIELILRWDVIVIHAQNRIF